MEPMREEYSSCHSKSQPVNIKLRPVDRDDRIRFIANALALLVESRFGPGCIYEWVEMTFIIELPLSEVDLDLMPVLPGLLFDGAGRASTDTPTDLNAANVINSTPIAEHLVQHHSPSTLARGSPAHRRTHIVP